MREGCRCCSSVSRLCDDDDDDGGGNGLCTLELASHISQDPHGGFFLLVRAMCFFVAFLKKNFMSIYITCTFSASSSYLYLVRRRSKAGRYTVTKGRLRESARGSFLVSNIEAY